MLAEAATALRAADTQKPIAADVRDGFWPASRQVDLLGGHSMAADDQHGNDGLSRLVDPAAASWLGPARSSGRGCKRIRRIGICKPWRQPGLATAAGFSEPVGPQPEQIRLLTYLSIAAGCRGIGYWSDQYLNDTHHGRDRLLTIALLNQELAMLEPCSRMVIDQPTWIDTSVPQVKAAVFICPPRGVLVIPLWLGEARLNSCPANRRPIISQSPCRWFPPARRPGKSRQVKCIHCRQSESWAASR